jgi:hypothetical protein
MVAGSSRVVIERSKTPCTGLIAPWLIRTGQLIPPSQRKQARDRAFSGETSGIAGVSRKCASEKKMMMSAYLGLGASATAGINPDVLGHHTTALVERHVLQELFDPMGSQYMYFLSGSTAIVEIQCIENQTHILRVGDDS